MTRAVNNDLSLWLIPGSQKGVRRIRLSRRLVYTVSIVMGCTLGAIICVCGDYAAVLVKRATDGYLLQSLESERSTLKHQNAALIEELERLRAENSQAVAFRENIKRRMDDFYSVVESGTALGLLKNADKSTQVFANAQIEPKAVIPSKEDKSILSRKAFRRRVGIDELRAINKGLGGAEIECKRDRRSKIVCRSSATKENVSLRDVKASLAPAVISADANSWLGDEDELLKRVSLYTEVVRDLPLGYPVEGETTSGFGYRISPFSRRMSLHEGIDISVDVGTKVLATADGIVETIQFHPTYGWMIDIRHSDQVITRYAHLKKILVEEGQVLSRGDNIALSGSTGRSTGPHLHYEVRFRGRAKNPTPFMALADKLSRFRL